MTNELLNRILKLFDRVSAIELRLWKAENPPKFKRGDKVEIHMFGSYWEKKYLGTIVQMEREEVGYREYLVMPDESKYLAENINENCITLLAPKYPKVRTK